MMTSRQDASLLWMVATGFLLLGIAPACRSDEAPVEQKRSFPLSKASWDIEIDLFIPEATQAAVADEKHIYAISNRGVSKFDRSSGKRIAISKGEAIHLNSGVLHQGKLYLAHSNYPAKPDKSDIKELDIETMQLCIHHDFGASEGSLTWAIPVDDGWWCHFAYYDKDNSRSYLAAFDSTWKERRRWQFPAQILVAFEDHSASGGVLIDQTLVVSGHDRRELYLFKRPTTGTMLEWKATRESPFPGQAIAVDPKTGGLVGIDRKQRKVIMAR